MTDLNAKYKEQKRRRLRRRKVWTYLFLAPLVGLWICGGVLDDTPYFPLVVIVVAPVSCYLQARYLKVPHPIRWGVAGLLFNIFAMVYLLGYAHGKGLPKAEP